MSLTTLGTGSALPRTVVTNEDIAGVIDTSDEWIRSRTGIEARRVLGEQTLEELGAEAAKRALEDAGMEASQIDLLLCTTVRGDFTTPSLACMIQGRIGAVCPAVDLNAACAGFLYALDMAAAYLGSGRKKRILIVSAEAVSRLASWDDRACCVLFGDGAGAAVVGQGEDLLSLQLNSRPGSEWLSAKAPAGNCPFGGGRAGGEGDIYLHMNGQEVYKFAVHTIVEEVRAALEELALQPQDVSLYLLHQANKRILDAARVRLRQSEDKFPMTLQRTGNISSACLPLLLDELNRAGRLHRGELLLLSAFGAGMVSATGVLRWGRD